MKYACRIKVWLYHWALRFPAFKVRTKQRVLFLDEVSAVCTKSFCAMLMSFILGKQSVCACEERKQAQKYWLIDKKRCKHNISYFCFFKVHVIKQHVSCLLSHEGCINCTRILKNAKILVGDVKYFIVFQGEESFFLCFFIVSDRLGIAMCMLHSLTLLLKIIGEKEEKETFWYDKCLV